LSALGDISIMKTDDGARNERFQEYVKPQSLFRGGVVSTEDDLKVRFKEALHDAMISLARAGVQESSKGRFYSGQALDWSHLDFQGRREVIRRILHDAMSQRASSRDDGDHLIVKLAGTDILVIPDAIPAAITVAAAKEMVGQPFLRDHELSRVLNGTCGGPVHIIGCHKNATEAQAAKLLGFPDATVVNAPFGVFVADNIQKVQFAFIRDCRDEANWTAPPSQVDNELSNEPLWREVDNKKRRRYEGDFKISIIAELAGGKSVAQIACEYGVHPSLPSRWRDQFEKNRNVENQVLCEGL
jgi:hypothetical protein